MRRIIVDYSKLTNEILTLLVDKFPDGYDDSNIIRFRNAHNELIEAVEVRTEDTIYLVKVSTKLASRLEKFDEEDIDDIVEPIDVIKDIDEDAITAEEDDEEVDVTKDPGGSDDEDTEDDDDDDDDFEDIADDDDDDDEE
jgi:DNA-directed RNA polymerase subunit delta